MSCGLKDGHLHIYPPLKAIRRKCLDCCCGSSDEVKHCHIETCVLHPYRFGKDPRRKPKTLSPKQLEALARGRSTLDTIKEAPEIEEGAVG